MLEPKLTSSPVDGGHVSPDTTIKTRKYSESTSVLLIISPGELFRETTKGEVVNINELKYLPWSGETLGTPACGAALSCQSPATCQ